MNLTLLTDLYQLTMAYSHWRNKTYRNEAVFHLYFRKNPFQNPYTIACGLAKAIDYLQNLRFETEDIQYLAALYGADKQPLFDESFLNYLQRFKFTCQIDAVPEGTIVFPNQPLVRIQGEILQAQLVETALLNILNFQSLIATKASRIVAAAQGEAVIEFGLRRAQGVDGAVSASRAAYIGGVAATSNVLAGQQYGVPVKGTHAHAWVMAFDTEMEAFEAYADAMPNNCIFLVDTYNTEQGVKNAITVGLRLREKGYEMVGIRLDSGDLVALSVMARTLLDESGFPNANIVASNDLDEYEIARLKAAGAKINVWGIGTKLVTAYDQPALGGVYKLAATRPHKSTDDADWKFKIKHSEDAIKRSTPGILQVRRTFEQGLPKGDILYHTLAPTTEEGQDLLVPIFRNGNLVYHSPTTAEIRKFAASQIALFKNVEHYTMIKDEAIEGLVK
jgi:nicotinate phosphoribosyltransferase